MLSCFPALMFLLINHNTFVSGKVGWNDSLRIWKTAVSPCSSPLGLFHKVAHLCLDQRQKFHTDDLKSVQNLARSYWLQMAVKRQMVKCKWVESTTKQSVFVEHSNSFKKKIIWVLSKLVSKEHKIYPQLTRRNKKSNKFTFGTPLITASLIM